MDQTIDDILDLLFSIFQKDIQLKTSNLELNIQPDFENCRSSLKYDF